jgi:plasmid stabilization system protein ParE
MIQGVAIQLTANFERNLADIEQFLTEAEAPQAFDGLIDELLGTVLPNLERFPDLGRPFFNRAVGSAEATHAIDALKAKLAALEGSSSASMREYVMTHYLVLYVQVDNTLFLLSIKHHKQLSFDFEGHWGGRAK